MKNHYTYRITNILHNMYYYGARTTTLVPTKDLGIKYFSTSSNKAFIQDQKDNPQNYKYKIIKNFNTRKEAIELEIKLHKKFDVKLHESFYNKVNQTTTGFDTTGTSNWRKGKTFPKTGPMSQDTKDKISKTSTATRNDPHWKDTTQKEFIKKMTGRKRTLESRKKMSESHLGQIAWNKGIACTEEQKKKIGDANRGRKLPQKTITCPHCNKSGGNAMKYWHFDNCKLKPLV